MDVAQFLNVRVEELAAFSALLFRKRPRHENEGAFSCTARSVVHYRRPSSANVPLSDVMRLAKFRSRRSKRFVRLLAAEEPPPATPKAVEEEKGRMQKKRRLLTYRAWCLLLRRRRRFLLRRRATTRRRIRRRIISLRYGKTQLPFCNCGSAAGAPPPSFPPCLSTQSSSSGGGRTAVLWLPSHWRFCRRFHYSVFKTRINGCSSSPDDDFSRLVNVRIAVPTKSQRKQHRVLQRWAARLPSCCALGKPPGRIKSKPMAVPPPLCFAAERSHMCVWAIQPRENGHLLTADEVMDILMIHSCKAPPVALHTRDLATMAQTSVGSVPHEKCWRRTESAVFYGYMWSLGKAMSKSKWLLRGDTEPCASDTTPIVVPVILLRNEDGDGGNYHLVASTPVYIGARARRSLDMRLISHWNPCSAPKPLCSMFELWCCVDAVSAKGADVPSTRDDSFILKWIRGRVHAALGRWCRVNRISSFTEQEGCETNNNSSSLITRTTVCVFPSIPPNLETIDHISFPVHRCVMSILFLSKGSFPQSDTTGSAVRLHRMRHFQFARKLFSSLSDTTATAWRTMCHDDEKNAWAFRLCQSLGYRRNVRIIGEEERETLLSLIGCPAFTDVSGNDASFQISRMARLRCSPSNAHQRVLLKFAARGGREHQREGSALFVLKPGSPAELFHVGAVTSAPFFSMRFGTRVAYAWVWDDAGWELVKLYNRFALRTVSREETEIFHEGPKMGSATEHSGAGSGGNIYFFLRPLKRSHVLYRFLRILPFIFLAVLLPLLLLRAKQVNKSGITGMARRG
ncbi:hypothetical protein MOQ_003594 [Trypanosoma cruzi marinkellei]|uniref:Uncharacterized protein n=1 Tax=Trypanosoma cruzi marinkellei TaxID=85056 RepID=K2NUB7_TRYCR|nr:hypothetical protein MOQ_003594 [Trypanosoma cruzi marinkellei]